MKVEKTILDGVMIITPDIFKDQRGYFYESYSLKRYEQLGLPTFIQDNHSTSIGKGVIRGIHFQIAPYSQSKLVRCTEGKIDDYVVDLRKSSKTYKKWIKVTLSEENSKQIFIPKGFGHAFITRSDYCKIEYKVDEYYNKESERSILWSDEEIGIDWELDSQPILSEKDKTAPILARSDINY